MAIGAFSLLAINSEPFRSKILNDEFVLQSTAFNLHFFRDAGARYNDLVYWSRPSDHLNQTTTPNSTSHYVYANINLSDGPVVFELPPSGETALYGNLHSAWQVPVEDFGPAGVDKGLGGRFLLTPPGYDGPVPPGMRAIAMPTRNGYFLLRPTPRSSKPRAAAQTNALIRQLRLYPLAASANPPLQRAIDMSGKLFDAITALSAAGEPAQATRRRATIRFMGSRLSRRFRRPARAPAGDRSRGVPGAGHPTGRRR